MTIVVIGAGDSVASSAITAFRTVVEAGCTAGRQRLRCAVSSRTEALNQQLQTFALELLAAIVLIAIFIVMTAPETPRNR